ncbi:MAG: helix-turn-helix transcriptional regulator [Clostridiales bacterium]
MTNSNEENMNIKNNLRKYRIWKNITQEDLARDLKISVNQLRLIECHNKYPKYQIRSRLCKYFDVSQDQMFFYSKEE